ncbi:MAG: 2-C-methyl-D-erythritol 4-phosphate cytidylyltransferase [Oscillospiraceae bacterium]|nr:2-C-methyl-D-erythritol 4-phosphate cytidylyltransferase [Oscillospiraceae bacterium]
MIFAAIFAGGVGNRMGAQTPKQYMDLHGRPVIVHTVEKFVCADRLERILVLCPGGWIDYTAELLEKHLGRSDKITVVEGGETRNDTLLRALAWIGENYGIDGESVIVTHDAVRPLVTRRIIDDNIRCALEYGACDTAVGATDTIVQSDDGRTITAIPDRAAMFQGQTPQSFNIKKLKETVESLTPEEAATLTDACKIYAIKGLPVHIVRGEAYNIKITYPTDIKIAEALLES